MVVDFVLKSVILRNDNDKNGKIGSEIEVFDVIDDVESENEFVDVIDNVENENEEGNENKNEKGKGNENEKGKGNENEKEKENENEKEKGNEIVAVIDDVENENDNVGN